MNGMRGNCVISFNKLISGLGFHKEMVDYGPKWSIMGRNGILFMVRNGILWYETGYYGTKRDIIWYETGYYGTKGYFMGIYLI